MNDRGSVSDSRSVERFIAAIRRTKGASKRDHLETGLNQASSMCPVKLIELEMLGNRHTMFPMIEGAFPIFPPADIASESKQH